MTCTYSSGFMNPELERIKELERRKKLRLLQVRQQSKEFADKLREGVRNEIIKQRKRYLEAENKLKQEKHLQELRQLKELYDKCLHSVGESHKEAAKQPDPFVEKQAKMARISSKAVERGAKALKKHLEDEATQKQKTEAPIKQKRAARNKENLRAFYISSLPKNVERHGVLAAHPKSLQQQTETREAQRVLEELPSNVTNPKYSQKHKSPEKSTVPRKVPKGEETEILNKSTLQGVPSRNQQAEGPSNFKSAEDLSNFKQTEGPSGVTKDCSCDYIVCACHRSPRELRRCSSESRISSENRFDFEEPRKKAVRTRSCSLQSVRTLNYLNGGNVYESNQQSRVTVTHHSRSPTRTEEPVPKVQEVAASKPSIEELKKRTDERSAKALRREQLKRDFQQLIQNLKKLTKEKSAISSQVKGKANVLCSERDILKRNETKQKKLNDAFERLPYKIKSTNTENTGTQKASQTLNNDSSPPTLNLAQCQTNMTSIVRRAVSSDEVSISTPAGSRRRGATSVGHPGYRDSEHVGGSGPPDVVVKKDPSGDVHITVKVSDVLGNKSKDRNKSRDRNKSSDHKSKHRSHRARSHTPTESRPQSMSPTRTRVTSPTSDSSYLSPPVNLTPSQQELLDALLHQVNKRGIGEELNKYIRKLLEMSRESINELRDYPHELLDIEEDLYKLNDLAEVYAEKVNKLVDMYEQMSSPSTPSSSPGYVDPIRAPPRETPGSSRPPTPLSIGSTPGTSRGFATPVRSTGSRSTEDSMDRVIFGGIQGHETPSPEEIARLTQPQQHRTPCPPPEGFDMDAAMHRAAQLIRISPSPDSGRRSGASEFDTSFDTSALQFPLNPEKLNAVRQKLARVSHQQYGAILEELHRDTREDQSELGKILERATSDPFLDPDATLAPIHPINECSTPEEWTFPRQVSPPCTPSSLGFSRTGITPPADRRIQESELDSPAGPLSPAWLADNERGVDTSNIQNMLFLAKTVDRLDKCKSPPL